VQRAASPRSAFRSRAWHAALQRPTLSRGAAGTEDSPIRFDAAGSRIEHAIIARARGFNGIVGANCSLWKTS